VKVNAVFRYPVKSMLGEMLDACDVDARGLAGDRRFALIDLETGTIASAKYPRKWERLLAVRARGVDADARTVEISFDDGVTIRTDDPLVDGVLSACVGRDVRISDTPPAAARAERIATELAERPGELGAFELGQGAPRGTFFDYAPVHLVTQGGLELVGGDFWRYRPNLVIGTDDDPGFFEDGWIGRTLAIGDARLRVITATPRCVVPTLAHDGGPRAPGLLRTIARVHMIDVGGQVQPCVGAYAVVTQAGAVRVGDRVEVLA
jgi:hypothetical protein